jgi:hypothetical protein
MRVQDIKLDILQKIMQVKEPALLKKINKLLNEEAVVAYSAKGKPLIAKDYNNRLKFAEKQIISGKSISQEELENEVESW